MCGYFEPVALCYRSSRRNVTDLHEETLSEGGAMPFVALYLNVRVSPGHKFPAADRLSLTVRENVTLVVALSGGAHRVRLAGIKYHNVISIA